MRSLLKYDESSPSGLRWLVDMNGGACAGDIAGSLHPDGYWLITIRERRFMAHRVIMHLVKGFDLESMLQVDHIDRNRSNNLISNLRLLYKTARTKVSTRTTLLVSKVLSFVVTLGEPLSALITKELGLVLTKHF